jgi:hypothetical protein
MRKSLLSRTSTAPVLPGLAWLALFACGPLSLAAAQEEGGGDAQEGGAGKEGEAEGEEEAVEDDVDAKWFAIVGGDVYTGSGAVLRGATVLSRNGVIHDIGHGVYLPEGTEKLDASGYRVYPGMVALGASARITRGLLSGDVPAESEEELLEDPLHAVDRLHVDAHEGGLEPPPAEVESERDVLIVGAELRAEVADSFDPFNEYLVLALAAGITTVEQSDTPLKLKRREIEDVDIGAKHTFTLSWTRGPGREQVREKLQKAAAYLRSYREWEAAGDKKAPEPSKKNVDANYVRILRGDVLAQFQATEREELLGIARLAQEFRFRPVIVGCQEGWTVADELGRAGAFAIITPRAKQPKLEQLVRPGGTSIENAALLHSHGVQVAIIPENTSFELSGITGRDLLHLPIEADFAVRGGLPETAALAAVTLVPARILGVDHRIGTLEVGKDLDAIVTDGDLLHYETYVQYTVVSGKLVYDKEQEVFFAHIRPRPAKPALDPGEEEGAAEEAKPEEEAAEDEDGAEEQEEDEQQDEGGGGEEEDEDGGGA